MPKRRAAPEISLSFLDVICCGFGAVILLLMITKTVEPQVLEESTVIAEGRVAELTEQLFEIRGETTVLNRDLAAKREQISEFEEQIAILQGSLASSKSRHDSLQTTRNSNSIVAEQLAIARQELSDEEERLLGRDAAPRVVRRAHARAHVLPQGGITFPLRSRTFPLSDERERMCTASKIGLAMNVPPLRATLPASGEGPTRGRQQARGLLRHLLPATKGARLAREHPTHDRPALTSPPHKRHPPSRTSRRRCRPRAALRARAVARGTRTRVVASERRPATEVRGPAGRTSP